MLIQLNNITLNYGVRTILDKAACVLTYDQKIAVIGRNGAGKSSLCRIITGDEKPNSGTVQFSSACRLSYLEQKDPYDPDDMVLDFLMSYSGKLEWECGKMAAKLGLNQDMIYMPIGSLSGGYQMRVKLTAMMLKDPNFLILDEPTNYLDLSTLLFLENVLREFKGSFMIVSHDREFLKRTCDHTMEVENGKMVLHKEGIEDYFEFKQEQIEHIEKFNQNVEKKKKQLQTFVDRFGSKATKASAAQSKMKQINKLKTIDIAHPMSSVVIRMPQIRPRKGMAFEAQNLSIGYPDKTVADRITFEINHGDHIAILGDNGQGKSTFLKTISEELKPLAGSFKWGYGVSVGYYAQHVYQELRESDTVFEALSSLAAEGTLKQPILDMAGSFLFRGDDVHKPVKVLSGGERARLCLAGLLMSGADVLLLDEPTNHLDFETVEALAVALQSYPGTVLLISHDRTFVNTIASGIIEVKEGRVQYYGGTYEEYIYYLTSQMGDVDDSDSEKAAKEEDSDAFKKKGKKKGLGAL